MQYKIPAGERTRIDGRRRRPPDALLQLAWPAALDPSVWQSLVAQIAETFGGAAGFCWHDAVGPRAGVAEFARFRPEDMHSYSVHYGVTNPWLHTFKDLPVGALLTRSLAPEIKLETTEFWQDWLRPQGLRNAMGGIVARHGPRSAISPLFVWPIEPRPGSSSFCWLRGFGIRSLRRADFR